jgi:hypothetical protein
VLNALSTDGAAKVPPCLDDVVLVVLIRVSPGGNIKAQQIWDDAALGGEGESLCGVITNYPMEILEQYEQAKGIRR